MNTLFTYYAEKDKIPELTPELFQQIRRMAFCSLCEIRTLREMQEALRVLVMHIKRKEENV
jgi:hypothetical protein